MKVMTGLVFLCLASLFASGCGKALVGHWRGVEVSGGDKSQFAFGTMEFNEDGTFKGIATLDGERKALAGTYKYDGFRLKLSTQEGLQTYWSTYNAFGPSLSVKREGVKAKIERVGK
jgi:hypothetical protein